MKPDKQLSQDPDAIDHMLGGEEQLVPSSGFLLSVMERVREEAITPQPIPFPWKRALPGVVLAAGTLSWLIYEIIVAALAGGLTPRLRSSSFPIHLPIQSQPTALPALWFAVAMAISLASWILARRIARGNSLL
jgi:hypothetical protein